MQHSSAGKKIVFILSADYSGSTWVGYVLGSHPASTFLGEYYRAWHAGIGQPCTTCAARGRAECELLHGIGDVPREAAFRWAFERSGSNVLIDSSKVTHWAEGAINGNEGADVRLIHLLRDPRGWFASRRRRRPDLALGATLQTWIEQNRSISAFARAMGVPCRTVFYDDLAGDPAEQFSRLFDFCEMRFDPAFLEYWTVAHHGFAGNGATSQIMPDELETRRVGHFITGDDAFYGRHRRRQFTDDRWRTDLSAQEADAIMMDEGVRALLESRGKSVRSGGLSDIAPPRLDRREQQ